MKDDRNPENIGRILLMARRVLGKNGPTVAEFADRIEERCASGHLKIPNYKNNEGPIEKYGRPQDRPEGV